MGEEIQTNMVLREMQAIAKKIESLEKKREAIRIAIDLQQGRLDAVTDQIIPLSTRAEKLSRVADIMDSDWREWHWAKEEQLDKKFPRR